MPLKPPSSDTVAAYLRAFGGRRFLMTLGAGLVDSLLLWFGKLTEGGYVTLTLATVGAFIGANTYQKRVEIQAAASELPADAASQQAANKDAGGRRDEP